MSESHTTTDHKKIKQWAEERDGAPATVKDTGKGATRASADRLRT